jgi:biopolymer transport protein ExbD
VRFRPRKPRDEPRIDLTSLIDVVFQLLLFFALSTTFVRERSLSVDLPVADASSSAERAPQVLAVSIDARGVVHHGLEALSPTSLDEFFEREAARDRSRVVLLRADAAVPHGLVVSVMDSARRAGLRRIAIGSRAR